MRGQRRSIWLINDFSKQLDSYVAAVTLLHELSHVALYFKDLLETHTTFTPSTGQARAG
jgi:hypothetical protein